MQKTLVAILAAAALSACGGGETKDNPAEGAAAAAKTTDTGGSAKAKGGSGDPAQPTSGTTGPGSWKRITKSDAYKPLIAAVVHKGAVYHAVKDGTLYATDLASGAMKEVSRKPDFGGIRWLMDAGDYMVSIERDGNVYKIGADASRQQIGDKGGYGETIAAAVGGKNLYTIDRDGTLYATDLETMKWKKLGAEDYSDTRMMLASGGALITVEKDGSAFNVDPKNAKWANLGPNDLWKKTQAAAFMGDRLFRVAPGGVLYEIAIPKGTNQPIGKPDFQHVRWMGATGDALITLEKDGSLYRVEAG